MDTAMIESVRIRGFRSLADVEISGLPRAAVLIGANGSGKSNFIRFFEMLSWMIKPRRLGEFIEHQGGADDQLFGGNRVTPRMDAEVTMRTDRGLNDYRFALSHAHPDRFFFSDEGFRFSSGAPSTQAEWRHLGSGHREAMIVETAQSDRTAPRDYGSASQLRRLPVSRHLGHVQLQDCMGCPGQQLSSQSRWQPSGRAVSVGTRGRPPIRDDLPAYRAHTACLRPLRNRGELRQGPPEVEGEVDGQDVRGSSHVRWLFALLRPRDSAKPSA